METAATRRLCSEIQLFDLCELESCSFKEGRFCTEAKILERFEAIKEEDERPQYLADGYDEEEGAEDESYDDADEYEDDDL